VKASAPARIDLSGGTLDIPPLCYFVPDTLTINLAIDLRAEITLGEGEGLVHNRDAPPIPAGTLPLFAQAFAYTGKTCDVFLENAIPRASGLGGSSTLLVALMSALWADNDPGDAALLDAVTVLENRLLGKPAGTQDATAAIHGGLSEIRFETGRVVRRPLPLPNFLEGPLYLAYSREQHHSGMNNWQLISAACTGDERVLSLFAELNENSHATREALCGNRVDAFLTCLQREARLRDRLWPGLAIEPMKRLAAGLPETYAAKVCGAGGGGCMWLWAAEPDEALLRQAVSEAGLDLLVTRADPRGRL